MTKLISRYFGKNIKRIRRVSTKSRCNIKLFHCNGFFVLLEERLSLMKYITMFVFCLFRRLYQGTDKILDFTKSVVRKQKLLGRIDKLGTLAERLGRGSSKTVCHVGGQWVSGQNELTFYYFFRITRVAQLEL